MKYVLIFLMSSNSVFAQESFYAHVTSQNVKWCDLPKVTRGELDYQDHTVVIEYQKDRDDTSISWLKLRTYNQFFYSCDSHYRNLLSEIIKHGGSMKIYVRENEYIKDKCKIIDFESEIIGIKYYGKINECSNNYLNESMP